MSGGGLSIRGGARSYAVAIESLELAATRVRRLGLEVDELARLIGACGPVIPAVVGPVAESHAAWGAVRTAAGPGPGAAGAADELAALSVRLSHTATAYREREAVIEAALLLPELWARLETLRIAQLGQLVGAFTESGEIDVDFASQAPMPVPSGLGDLVAGQVELGQAEEPSVRVIDIDHADGEHAWIVQIAGTQVWDPWQHFNPYDSTSDVVLMVQRSGALATAVWRALDDAQGRARDQGRDPSAEPVMLTGHSLGGIVAMALAGNRKFREEHDLTHVVTLGSPVGGFDPPPGLKVLSVEHRGDLVPLLDGRPNPATKDWVTLTADPAIQAGLPIVGSPIEAHEADTYRATAIRLDQVVDKGDVSELAAWAAGAAAFLRRATRRRGRDDEEDKGKQTRYRIGRPPS